MANSKISALTSATTPLAGTEVLPIVQSSATVKVSVANLTPGLDTITAAKGGTGQTSYAVGDLLYANTTTTLAKLADVATGNALISGGVSTAPSWGKIGLTTHVSGTLPTANGGTNLTSFTSGGVVYASSTSALATGSALTFDGTLLNNTGAAPKIRVTVTGGSVYSTLESDGVYATGTDLYLLAPASKFISFYAGNSERARIPAAGGFQSVGSISVGNATPTTSGAGITFPATQSASSDANTLDDYEEGTWTPSYTLGAGSATLNSASGSYVKIGKQVNLTLYISFSSATAAFINTITGFPFTSETASQLAVGALRESSNTGFMWLLQAGSNSTTAFIRKYDNTQALTAGDSFVGTLTYFTT